MSKLEVGTEVWADIAEPHNIALTESEGRPGVVVHVQPEEEPDAWDDEFDEYGWNGDDVFVRWNNGVTRSYQYKNITPFNPDDELDWDYEAFGLPAVLPPLSSPYLEELNKRYHRIDQGLFALGQVDNVHPLVIEGVRQARDYVATQITHEKEKL